MLKEFKEFINRGNVMDMAVGVIIGGAFSKIVNSLVADIIMPLIGLITGGNDVTNLFLSLDGNEYATLEEAVSAGVATFNYGVFIQSVIDFLIISFILFLIIRQINKLKKPVEAAPPKTKICPFCKSEIAIDAVRCPNCTSKLENIEQ